MNSEIAKFVEFGSSHISIGTMEKLMHKLALLKAEFTQINEPKLPHLVDQLEFLADLVEDVIEGEYKEMPYGALSAAAFALVYAHKAFDIIPDNIPLLGHADDSSVVRYVLIKYENALKKYAKSRKINWNTITTAP